MKHQKLKGGIKKIIKYIIVIIKMMKINLAFTYALLMLLCCVVLAARKKAEKDPRFQYNNQVAKSILRDDSTDSLEASLAEARSVTEMHPDIAQGWANLGILLQSKDLTSHNGGALRVEALGAFEKAIEVAQPHDIETRARAYFYKAVMLKMMSQGQEALDNHDAALTLVSHSYDVSSILFHKADCFVMMGRLKDGLEFYLKSMELKPQSVGTFLPIVSIHEELRILDKAGWNELIVKMEAAYEKCKAGEYDNVPMQKSDAGIKRLLLVHVSDAERCIKDSSILWALFKAGHKAGVQQKAWDYLVKAHDVEIGKRSEGGAYSFRETDLVQQTENIKNIFQSGFWLDGVGDKSRAPIFIIGMMRSGSTLLETMLDTHPEILALGEDSIFNGDLKSFRDDLVDLSLKVPPNDFRYVPELNRVIKDHSKKILKEMFRQSHFFTHPDQRKTNPRRVVDKMLFNYRNLGFIHLMFPNAVIIHTIRDPLDTMHSIYKNKFDDTGLEWSLRWNDLTAQYAVYLDIMDHFRKNLPGRVIDVRYEELVYNPEPVLRKILHKIGVRWDDKVLEFHESRRMVQTFSQQQVRHELYNSSIGAWRKYAKQYAPLISALKPRIEKLRKNQALVYEDSMNWNLDPNFDYESLAVNYAAEIASQEVGKYDDYDYEDDDDDYSEYNNPTSASSSKKLPPPVPIISDPAVPEKVSAARRGEVLIRGANSLSEEERKATRPKPPPKATSTTTATAATATTTEPKVSSAESSAREKSSKNSGTVSSFIVPSIVSGDSKCKLDLKQGDIISLSSEKVVSYLSMDGTHHQNVGLSCQDDSGDVGGDVDVGEANVARSNQAGSKRWESKPNSNTVITDEKKKKTTTTAQTNTVESEGDDGSSKKSSSASSTASTSDASSSSSSSSSISSSKPAKDSKKNSKKNSKHGKDSIGSSGGQLDVHMGQGSDEWLKRLDVYYTTTVRGKYYPVSQIQNSLPMMFHTSLGEDMVTPESLVTIAYLLIHSGRHKESCDIFYYFYKSIEKSSDDGLFEGELNSAFTILNKFLVYKAGVNGVDRMHVSNFFLLYYGGWIACSGHLGHSEVALTIVSSVLNVFPRDEMALYKRAEIYIMLGQNAEALRDFDSLLAEELKMVSRKDIHITKASIFFRDRRFGSAFIEFNMALDECKAKHCAPHDESAIWNYLGKCEKEFGTLLKANISHSKAIALNPALKEAYMDRAIALMEQGHWQEAIDDINILLRKDDKYRNANGYMGLLLQSMGRTSEAIQYFEANIIADPTDKQCTYLRSVCLHALGNFSASMKAYTDLLKDQPTHDAWFRRELLAYQIFNRDVDISTYTQDRDVSDYIRSGLSHKVPVNPSYDYVANYYKKYLKERNSAKKNHGFAMDDDIHLSEYDLLYACSKNDRSLKSCRNTCANGRDVIKVILAVSPVSNWIHLRSVGFFPNHRQHRMYGLCVLNIAQEARLHASLLLHNLPGQIVKTDSSSRPQYYNIQKVETRPGFHYFGWRDLYDITARWRQVVEPMDIVWWIDALDQSPDSLERVGLNTYMVHGHNQVTRYYTYYNKSIEAYKRGLLTGRGFDKNEEVIKLKSYQIKEVEKSKETYDLFRILGNQPSFVVGPAKSVLNPDLILNGTRITIQKTMEDGYDFSICSASTPERFIQYEMELNAGFQDYMKDLQKVISMQEQGIEIDDSTPEFHQLVTNAVRMFYFWVNYAPLTRGSSATGYASLFASVMATGRTFADRVPEGMQLDWEAMLAPTLEHFIDVVKDFVYVTIPMHVPAEYLDVKDWRSDSETSCFESDDDDDDGASCIKPQCKLQVRQIFKSYRTQTKAINWNNHILPKSAFLH